MKRLVAIISPALLAACASAAPPEGPATQLIPAQPAPPVQLVEKVVPVLVPSDPVVKEKRRVVDPVAATRAANARAMEMPRPERFINSTLVYPIIPGAIYNVLTAINDLTSIEMPPGCRINKKSPMIGDRSHQSDDQSGSGADMSLEEAEPANWEIAKTYHGTMRDPVSKIVVRPNKVGLKTKMMVDTDCGSFTYKLISTESSPNATVKFRQERPNMGLPEAPEADERKEGVRAEVLSCVETPVSQVQYGYSISGDKPAWRPADRDVFHNGSKLCIGLPDGLGNLETPSIERPVGDDGMTVYYRMAGRFIEIDQILPSVELKLGDDKVRLTLKR